MISEIFPEYISKSLEKFKETMEGGIKKMLRTKKISKAYS
jgi:hypothetical protein